MKTLKWIGGIFLVLAGALFGNYLGDKLRYQLTGNPGHQLELVHWDDQGNTYITANLLLSNFIPAVLVGMVQRPRPFMAFLVGMLISILLGDRFEDRLWETMDEALSGGDPTKGWEILEKKS